MLQCKSGWIQVFAFFFCAMVMLKYMCDDDDDLYIYDVDVALI